MKNNFKNPFSNFFNICLLLRKLVNEKYFSVKEKISLIFLKIFFFYFEYKNLPQV
jgi:hypothetical protein